MDLARRWPEEPKSAEKHLGKVLRSIIARHYPQGSISKPTNEQELTSVYESFNRLSHSVYLKKYPRQFNSSATGLKKSDVEGTSLAEIFGILRARAGKIDKEESRDHGKLISNTFKSLFGGGKSKTSS